MALEAGDYGVFGSVADAGCPQGAKQGNSNRLVGEALGSQFVIELGGGSHWAHGV
jgi:hypothetical protein